MSLSTKHVVCLGLVSGAVFSLNTPVIAQVQITGGDFSGNAGFFLPSMGAEVKILDATVETLNLESAIGNTSTAVFTPTATRFDNNINPSMATVDQGDTGTLQGLLTGLAYDDDGYPVIFTSIPTQLDFAVNTFSPANSFTGTLIQPEVVGAAPLLFINRTVTLEAESEANFDAVAGQLDVGTLNADLNGGEFNLPTTWSFASGGSSGGNIGGGSTGIERRIRFKFYGDNVTPETGTDLTGSDRIRFIGAANDKFEIRTVGSRSNGEFKIKANDVDNALVDIVLGGPFSRLDGEATDIDITQALDYKIRGEATGNFTALLGGVSTTTEFSGTARRDIRFEFEQGHDEFKGRSEGLVQFVAAIGGAELTSDGGSGSSSINTTSIDTNVGLGGCNVCTSNTSSSTSTTTTQTVAVNARFMSIEDLLDDNTDNPDATVSDTSGSADDLSTDEYEALQEQLAELDINIDVDIDITVMDVGLERYYVARPRNQRAGRGRGNRRRGYYENEIVCYRQVGPGSSIFPGLIALVEVEFGDIPVDIFVGLPEIADADVGDDAPIDEGDSDTDTDVDDDNDSDDDGDDDDNDSDDDGDDDDSDGDDGDDDDDSDDDDDGDDDDDSDGDDGDDDDDDSDDDDDDTDNDGDVIIIEGLPEIDGDAGNSDSDASTPDDVIIIEGLPEISQ